MVVVIMQGSVLKYLVKKCSVIMNRGVLIDLKGRILFYPTQCWYLHLNAF